MNLAERVLWFLRKHPDQPYCDECLAAEVGTKRSLSRMLDVFSPDYVRRGLVQCARCQQERYGIVLIATTDGPPATIN